MGKTIGKAGVTATAAVTVDPTLTAAKVDFQLGNRTVCTDTAAPFTCFIAATGAETGKQTVLATVTDSAGQTASASAATTVSRFRSTASIHIKRGKSKRRIIRTISGRLSFSKRVTKAQGCSTGTVTLSITKNGNTLFPLNQVPLRPSCSYALRFKIPKTRRHRFAVSLSFGGNQVLLPTRNKRRFK